MMQQAIHSTPPPPAASHGYLEAIRHHMAEALIGRKVGVLSRRNRVTHGIVTGVINEDGVDKLVIGGMEYDLRQLLTVLPKSSTNP